MSPGALGLPITLDVEGKKVVLLGRPDDEETARKRALLAESGALIHETPTFTPAVLEGALLVLVTLREPALAGAVHVLARTRGVLCWCVDDPAHSDLALPAIVRAGRARLAISTSGASPMLAARLRAALEEALGPRFTRFVEALGARREAAKREEPDPERRRARLAEALSGFACELRLRYPDWFERAP